MAIDMSDVNNMMSFAMGPEDPVFIVTESDHTLIPSKFKRWPDALNTHPLTRFDLLAAYNAVTGDGDLNDI